MFWDIGSLNWAFMRIEVSSVWEPTDRPILFNYPYTENYEYIDIFKSYASTYKSDTDPNFYPGTTLNAATESTWLSGYNKLDTIRKELTFVINGSNSSSKNLEAKSAKCRLN